jgi:hypothetical protein
MNVFLQNIFTGSHDYLSNKEIIRWWERRRVFYNAVMFVAGLVTMMLALLLREISFSELVNVLPPVLIFGFSANLFYTLGWITEIVARRMIPEKEFVKRAGPLLFISGLCLSVFLTVAIDIAMVIAFFFGNHNS